ncbi:hypothetical protein QZH41_013480 [Actinostola sp. cb2023]|nr:hypothetical protein QZH41_013480 [Actinostola sp. cb2023]
MADENAENLKEHKNHLIREGKHVMLKLNKNLKVVLVQRNRKIFFEKLRFVINEAIGCPVGSVFEVKGGQLSRASHEENVDELRLRTAENGDKGSLYQAIRSDGPSQKLSRDDVVSLKAQGVTGKDIVDQLVENSATFKDRTDFSKAKYRSKKSKKHNTRITILQPSTSLIAEMYYNSKASYKVCDLRPDALSQILTLANIRATSNVIVMEQCQGLVIGAVLERMGGKKFKQSKRYCQEKIARRNKRKQEEMFAKNCLQSKKMDGLLVVCKFHPSLIVLSLLDYVAPSRPFVVYSQYKEPLVECYNDLRNRGGVVNLQLTKTWWRHYQVLPGRTHPLVTMDGSGGYLLSGITVERTCSSNSSSESVTVTRTVTGTVPRTVAGTVTGTVTGTVPRTVTGTVAGTVTGTVTGTVASSMTTHSSPEKQNASQTQAEDTSLEPPAKKHKDD